MGQAEHSFRSFVQKGGNTDNSIRAIVEDQEGFLWVATENGLDRFDGRNFLSYRFDPKNPNSINTNRVNKLALEGTKRLWIGTPNGVCHLDLNSGLIKRIEVKDSASAVIVDDIRKMLIDSSGNIWIGSLSRGLFKLTPEIEGETYSYKQFMPKDQGNGLSNSNIRGLFQMDREYLWIGTSTGIDRLHLPSETFVPVDMNSSAEGLDDQGVYKFFKDQTGNIVYPVHRHGLFFIDTKDATLSAKPYFSDNLFSAIPQAISYRDALQDRQGQIWVSSGNGVYVVDVAKESHEYLQFGPKPSAGIRCLFESRDGTIWVGTSSAGIIREARISSNYSAFLHEADDSNSLLKAQVRTMVEDQQGNLWVGYLKEGLDQYKWDEDQQSLVKLQHLEYDPTQSNGLLSNSVIQIFSDSKGFLWIASNGAGLNKFDPVTGEIESYVHDPNNPNTLSGNRIWALSEDRDGYIWVGEFLNGLNRLNPETGEVTRFQHDPNNANSLSHNRIKTTFVDSHGDLWIGTNGGLNRLEIETGQFTHYLHDPENINSLSNNLVWSIYEDSLHNLWVGTSLGLNKLMGAVGPTSSPVRFERLYETEGLPSNSVWGIEGDGSGNIWISTNKGLAQLIQNETGSRLQLLETGNDLEYATYPPKSHYYSKQHQQFYFGTNEGMVVVPSRQDQVKSVARELVLSAVSKYSDEEEEEWVDHFISTKGKLTLTHQDRILTIQLSEILWEENSRFEYRLKGFDANWRPLPEEMKLTYTDLAAGRYTLLGRPLVEEGEIGEEQVLLQLRVYPPWWETSWAYLLYALGFLGVIYGLYRFQLQQQLKKQETENLRALDQFKNQLYTNITHEFKTPLTVIGGLIEQVKGHEKIKGGIRRNSSNLLDLVNQILDLRKLESGKIDLDWRQADVVMYFQYILESHEPLAEMKDVSLHFIPRKQQILMDIDKEKLLRILSNLLSNAIKFTPAEGHIYLNMAVTRDGIKEGLQFSVRDTGVGIPLADQAFIFDRFYQAQSSTSNGKPNQEKNIQYRGPGGGSGIGLALTKDLVELLGGEIQLESEVGKGSTFTVWLPITRTALMEEIEALEIVPPVVVSDEPAEQEQGLVAPGIATHTTALQLLIVEDNDDIRDYLVSLLQSRYALHLAKDGKEGVEKALEIIPDIIVSDVMMPHKDGFELLSELKADIRTSHIPIVMLTAKSSVASRIQGLKRGADAYLSKPFNQEELFVRLAKLLELRQVLRKRYANIAEQGVSPSEEVAFEQEDAFITELKDAIEKHMGEPGFGVAELCEVMGMTRSVLHKKLSALANTNATHLIRTLRLHKASQLLQDEVYNVSEVAEQVGFKDISYFSRTFRKEFGVSPRAFREGLE